MVEKFWRGSRIGASTLTVFLITASLFGCTPTTPAKADSSASSTSDAAVDLSTGLQVLDTLQDLKMISEQRLADCNSAIGDAAFCKCVNDRFTLELSFVDYVALVTSHPQGDNNNSLSSDKLKYRDEAEHVREICAAKTPANATGGR